MEKYYRISPTDSMEILLAINPLRLAIGLEFYSAKVGSEIHCSLSLFLGPLRLTFFHEGPRKLAKGNLDESGGT
jgi:hypothetical protein